MAGRAQLLGPSPTPPRPTPVPPYQLPQPAGRAPVLGVLIGTAGTWGGGGGGGEEGAGLSDDIGWLPAAPETAPGEGKGSWESRGWKEAGGSLLTEPQFPHLSLWLRSRLTEFKVKDGGRVHGFTPSPFPTLPSWSRNRKPTHSHRRDGICGINGSGRVVSWGTEEPPIWFSHRSPAGFCPSSQSSVSNSLLWGRSMRLMGGLQPCSQQVLHRCWDPSHPSGCPTAGWTQASH